MSWLANLKTRTKLLGAFGIVCAMIGGLGWTVSTRMAQLNAATMDIATYSLPSVRELGKLREQATHLRLYELRYMLSTTPELRESMNANIAGGLAELKKTLDDYQRLVTTPEERKLMDKFAAQWTEYQTEQKRLLDVAKAQGAAAVDGLIAQKSRPLFDAAMATLVEDIAYNDHEAEVATKQAAATFERARTFVIVVVAAAAVISVLLAFVIAGSIAKPLAHVVDALKRVAGGDFTTRLGVRSRDEVGQVSEALDETLTKVQQALRDVRDVSDTLTTAAQQMSSASEEISSGAQEQAASLEQTSANLEEMTATVRQSADNARQASQLAGGSRSTAEKGGQIVAQTVSAMSDINAASKQIADIITTIDEIAFQTNLLALNAAVEAARAGEQGRGFAVVASEVRNLAQRSASAAKEIKGKIQDSVRKVEGGSELADRSGTTLQEIISSVKRVTDIVDEMASAAREQATGIDQVNKAVAQMDQVTQANAAQTEEMSSTAQALSGQAEQLRDLVSRFRLGEDDQRRTTTARTVVKPPRSVVIAKRHAPARVQAAAPAATNGHHHDVEMDAFMAAAEDGFESA